MQLVVTQAANSNASMNEFAHSYSLKSLNYKPFEFFFYLYTSMHWHECLLFSIKHRSFLGVFKWKWILQQRIMLINIKEQWRNLNIEVQRMLWSKHEEIRATGEHPGSTLQARCEKIIKYCYARKSFLCYIEYKMQMILCWHRA